MLQQLSSSAQGVHCKSLLAQLQVFTCHLVTVTQALLRHTSFFLLCTGLRQSLHIAPAYLQHLAAYIYIYIYICIYRRPTLAPAEREREREREMYTYKRVSVRVWDCQFFEQFNYSRIVWLCLQLFTCV